MPTGCDFRKANIRSPDLADHPVETADINVTFENESFSSAIEADLEHA